MITKRWMNIVTVKFGYDKETKSNEKKIYDKRNENVEIKKRWKTVFMTTIFYSSINIPFKSEPLCRAIKVSHRENLIVEFGGYSVLKFKKKLGVPPNFLKLGFGTISVQWRSNRWKTNLLRSES